MFRIVFLRRLWLTSCLLAVMGASAGADTDHFHHLIGNWVRPDATYSLIIEHVDQAGGMVASFWNGHTFTEADAVARHTAGQTEIDVNLRRLGKSGHTYHLRYDVPTDRLIGTYHHHVFRQDYDIFFVRQ